VTLPPLEFPAVRVAYYNNFDSKKFKGTCPYFKTTDKTRLNIELFMYIIQSGP
jgi:hypothetical protein